MNKKRKLKKKVFIRSIPNQLRLNLGCIKLKINNKNGMK